MSSKKRILHLRRRGAAQRRARDDFELALQVRSRDQEQRAHSKHGRQREQSHVVQNNTDEEVEWDSEAVHHRASDFLGNVRRAHLHHAWPENSYQTFKD